MKIDTAFYNNKKGHQLEGYFIVDDTILSRDFSELYVCVSYAPAFTVDVRYFSLYIEKL